VNLDSGSHVSVHQGGLSTEVNWKLDNDYKFTSISAFRFWNFTPHNDDGLDVPITSMSARWRGTASSRKSCAWPRRKAAKWNRWLARITTTRTSTTSTSLQRPAGRQVQRHAERRLGQPDQHCRWPLARQQLCLFGQSIWHIDPKWDLTAGLRATYEDKRAYEVRYAPTGGALVTAPRWLRAMPATVLSIPAISRSTISVRPAC
jgi:iron complex outermembrane receptor protein